MIQIIQIEKDNSWNSFVIIRIFTADKINGNRCQCASVC